jgi:hypothetical protein
MGVLCRPCLRFLRKGENFLAKQYARTVIPEKLLPSERPKTVISEKVLPLERSRTVIPDICLTRRIHITLKTDVGPRINGYGRR